MHESFMPDLVILDEFISLIDHANHRDFLINLLRVTMNNCTSSIICDALLNTSWLEVLTTLNRHKKVKVIINSYLPEKNK